MFSFLFQVVLVSLSGVMAPGPVTSAALAAGLRRKHAGILIALGHAVIEFPLMLLIVTGMGRLFESPTVGTLIGLIGGGFLLHMGVAMIRSLKKIADTGDGAGGRHPFWTGVMLTASNPYFLLWWATVGLNLSRQAAALGSVAFTVFALTHWLCDLVWLEILTQASFHGRRAYGPRMQQIVLVLCSGIVLVFGVKFIYAAIRTLMA